MEDARAHALADAAFAEIAAIHRLMSFQETESELSQINRYAAVRNTRLDGRTEACLRKALDLAEMSEGMFDPVAAASTGDASWRDVELADGKVRFARPLGIDLSGIAKGYAVDRACEALLDGGASRAIVNAGGDLRVIGDIEEAVALRPFDDTEPALVTIHDGALASSDTRSARAQGTDRHIDGRTREASPDRFVTVVAPFCIDADALTKIVLVAGDQSRHLLARFGAAAYVHDHEGWAVIGEDV